MGNIGHETKTRPPTRRRVHLWQSYMVGLPYAGALTNVDEDIQSVMSGSAMRIIEISSDSDEDASVDGTRVVKVTDIQQHKTFHLDDVIELTDSDSSLELPDQLSPMVQRPKSAGRVSHATRKHISLYADTSDEDGAIVTMNDPPRSRKPIHISSPTKNVKIQFPTEAPVDRPTRPSGFASVESILPRSPSKKHPVTPSTDKSTSTPSKLSKKAREAKEQARREQYAADLFAQLNGIVFDDRLPKETKLEWNKRLLTTAGRARWHRSRDGMDTTKIELSVKILDCEERIRNTLSHEMCHLACWVINNKPQEGHGQLFKSWGIKVMRKYPDIQVSTRHNYEISYPYEWKCERCSKVYGRYSKSIRPETCVCGVCKVGKLVPQFSGKAMAGASQSTAAERRLNVPLLESLGSGVLCDANGLADVFRDVHI